MNDSLHPWLAFYSNQGEDHRQRSLIDIWTMTFDELEREHDYIQWLFPLPEPSPVNPEAPILDDDLAGLAQVSKNIQINLLRSYDTMAAFWGFFRHDEGIVKPTGQFDIQSKKWLCDHNHNQLRITRMLKCLSMTGHHSIANQTCQFLLAQVDTAGYSFSNLEAIPFWMDAVSGGETEELTLDDFEPPSEIP